MKNIARLIFILLLFIFLAWLFTHFPDHAEYNEKNWFSYFVYTDKEIRGAPKISDSFIYHYDAPDGGSREMSSVLFYGVSDASLLEPYLKSLGFSLEKRTENGTEETWQSQKNRNAVFTINLDTEKNRVRLTKTIL